MTIYEIDYTVTVELTIDATTHTMQQTKRDFKRRLNACFIDGCDDWSKPGNIAIQGVSEK